MGLFMDRYAGNGKECAAIMYKYIEIEDLVGGALVEQMRRDESARTIRLRTLVEYGEVVIRILGQSGQNAMLILSRESTNCFLHDYADYFDVITEPDGEEAISLRQPYTTRDLRLKFRRNLTADLLRAYTNEESLKVLKEA